MHCINPHFDGLTTAFIHIFQHLKNFSIHSNLNMVSSQLSSIQTSRILTQLAQIKKKYNICKVISKTEVQCIYIHLSHPPLRVLVIILLHEGVIIA
jgi:hypothetical protein